MKKYENAPIAIVSFTVVPYGMNQPMSTASVKKIVPEIILSVNAFETIFCSLAFFCEISWVVVRVNPKSASAPAIARNVVARVKSP